MKHCRILGALSIALAVASGCDDGSSNDFGSADGEWAQTGSDPWRLVPDLSIGEIEGEPAQMFGSITDVLPGPGGGIWVLDGQALELRLFDALGELVRTVGGAGDGPGEFRGNTCAFLGPDGEVWVENRRTWHRFSRDGDLLDTRPSGRSASCTIVAWTPSGSLVLTVVSRDPETATWQTSFVLQTFSTDGQIASSDTVMVRPAPTRPGLEWQDAEGRTVINGAIPLSQQAFSRMGPTGDHWVVDGTGDYLVRRESVTGDTLLVFGREFEPVPAPDSLRARLISELDHTMFGMPVDFDPSDVPTTFPPIDEVHISPDGTAWLVRRVQGGRREFDVFSPSGRYLGPVAIPSGYIDMSVRSVHEDYILATLTDELGVQCAVRFVVDKPAS